MPGVLRISEAASLGMHAMVLLASDRGRVLSAHEVAARLNASEAHLSKVMQRLGRAGLVQSVRGPRGGFSLARSPDAVTLLEVYEAALGEPALPQAPGGGEALEAEVLFPNGVRG